MATNTWQHTDNVRGWHELLYHFKLPRLLLDQISHFFEHYKDLENNKWVKIDGWFGLEEAQKEIMASVARYQGAPEKPCF